MHSLNIIGAGNLGRTLGRLWHERQVFRVGGICNRSLASAREAVAFIGAGSAATEIGAMAPADFWLIAVPDDHIEVAAQALAAHLQRLPQHAGANTPSPTSTPTPTPVVFHCSGAMASSVLTDCLPARIASAHPVHSFADPARSLHDLPGSYVALEGDASARSLLEEAFANLECSCITLTPEQKVLYHAGSVMACNYLTVLLDLSLRTFSAAGIDENTARQLLGPIVVKTAQNNIALGPQKALTGPLVRGDIRTVARQLDALSQLTESAPPITPPTLADAYRLLGKAALPLAQKAGLNADTAQKLHTLFDEQTRE
ncbi:DUF2520 domain-containing protein [Microbulbifer salipaludis]|uniref:DUF2520 domain-containing protein n=1 Tax=Microbulbifer salipaludis TaxID=187980 RepID=A0ABS3E776_9GAMM|nr:Rossmann-like and DUF2520 domain-containing protein [Microbulbifer salipaludis]MBN8431102.1 DUF2520 domain-containing protein [Microbulbifer salipaludis]